MPRRVAFLGQVLGRALGTTPASRRVVLAGAVVLFLTAPVAMLTLLGNDPPLPADISEETAVLMAFGGFLATWALSSPLSWGVVWLALRRYPGRVGLLAWNAARPAWSGSWTAFLGLAILVFVATIPFWDLRGAPFFTLHMAADIWFLLVLRAALVAQQAAGA